MPQPSSNSMQRERRHRRRCSRSVLFGISRGAEPSTLSFPRSILQSRYGGDSSGTILRRGSPVTSVFGGTLSVTKARMATTLFSPTTTPDRTVAWPPTSAFLPMWTLPSRMCACVTSWVAMWECMPRIAPSSIVISSGNWMSSSTVAAMKDVLADLDSMERSRAFFTGPSASTG